MFPPYFSIKNNSFFAQQGDKLVSGNDVVPIVDEIPRFVSDGSYASAFGEQWKRYKKVQFDSVTNTTITRSRLDRCLGDELNKSLAGKLVLEAGCGAGRFTEILLDKGATLISSDISSAAEVNKENFPLSDHHRVIQADINAMPFEKETFDVVICLGVIQHTPSPEKTIRDLYSLVKKGGTLVIDHYTFSKSFLLRSATIYRWFLKRKKPDFTIPYTQKLVKRYLPLQKRYANNKLMSVILNRISPVITYYRAFPELSNEHQEQWAFLDTHDSLTDWYKHLRSKGSIVNTLQKLGATEIWSQYGGNGVEARCKKPQ